MKAIIGVWAALAICFLASAGCKKSSSPAPPKTDYYGVTVDWRKLDTEFVNNDPAVQDGAYMAKRHIRYERFPQALVELDKLVRNPGLSEPQKKVVNELIEQTKQVIAKTPPAQ
jgi:hypothetical protein